MGKPDATWPSFVNYPEKILTKLQTEHPQSESEKLNIIIGRWRAGGGGEGERGGYKGGVHEIQKAGKGMCGGR